MRGRQASPRPAWTPRDERIEPRWVTTLAVSFDHRLADGAQGSTFLATVARHLVIRQHRRRLLERAYLDTLALLPAELAPSPEERLIALESLQAVDQALDALAPKVREAFLLANLEGLSYADIATRLGVSMTSVKRYLAQGYERCFVLALS